MIKKIIVLGITLVILFSIVGCVNVETYYRINEDGTGYNSTLVTYQTEVLGMLGLDVGLLNDEIFRLTDGLNNIHNSSYYSGDVAYIENDVKYKGTSQLVYFEDVEDIFSTYSNTYKNKLNLTNRYNGVSRLDVYIDEISEDYGDNVIDTLFKETGGSIELIIEIDKEVINHNATKVEGNRYTWDFIDIVENREKYGEFLFIDFKKGKNIENAISRGILGGRGITRDYLESEMGLDNTTKSFHGEALEKLGVLKGTEHGLELDKPVTRVEGVVLFSRLLGIEEEIQVFKSKNRDYTTGFTDIPVWAEDIINYLHYMGLVTGVSETEFGSNNLMSENSYTTLILRAMGYSESEGGFSWGSAAMYAKDLGFYKDDVIPYNRFKNGLFSRGFMSYITYNSLFVRNPNNGIMLLDNFK